MVRAMGILSSNFEGPIFFSEGRFQSNNQQEE
jgi:hypothetical protein